MTAELAHHRRDGVARERNADVDGVRIKGWAAFLIGSAVLGVVGTVAVDDRHLVVAPVSG